MERPELLKKLRDLEIGMESIRAELYPESKKRSPIAFVQRTSDFLTANWVLLSLLFAIGTVAVGRFFFGINYFEDYAAKAEAKASSDSYVKQGNALLGAAEWKAAEAMYREALKVSPSNLEATYGVLKAQVFQPLEGYKSFTPNVVDIRLDWLEKKLGDDRDICFLRAARAHSEGDDERALSWLRLAVSKDPNDVAAYYKIAALNTGYYDSKHVLHVDFEEAQRNFQKAHDISPNDGPTNSGLGSCYFLSLNFGKAIEYLTKSFSSDPYLPTALTLGEAYRYSRDYGSALKWHQHAMDMADATGSDQQRQIGGIWNGNFMPLRPGDRDTPKQTVQISTADATKAYAHFALSIDYALSGKRSEAEREFDMGLNLDKTRTLKEYFVNQMLAAKYLLVFDSATASWLERHMK